MLLANNCFLWDPAGYLKVQKAAFKSQDACCLTGDTCTLESMMFYFYKFDERETFSSNWNQNWHILLVFWSYCERFFSAHCSTMKMCHVIFHWNVITCAPDIQRTLFTIQSILMDKIKLFLSCLISCFMSHYTRKIGSKNFCTLTFINIYINEWMNICCYFIK